MDADERAAKVWAQICEPGVDNPSHRPWLIAQAVREAVAEEREACAKLAESLDKPSVEGVAQMVRTEACCDIAAEIRARK